MWRRLVMLAALGALALGCDDDDDDDPLSPGQAASLRLVHAVADGPPLDVYLDGALVREDLAFGDVLGYVQLEDGAHTVVTRVQNTNVAVANETIGLSTGAAVTVAVVGQAAEGTIDALVLDDDRTQAGPDLARLRVVHAAPSAGTVDVYVTEPTADLATASAALTGLAFGGNAYLPTTPTSGTVRIRVTVTGDRSQLVADTGAGGIPIQGGKGYTAIVLDRSGGGSPIQVKLLTDF